MSKRLEPHSMNLQIFKDEKGDIYLRSVRPNGTPIWFKHLNIMTASEEEHLDELYDKMLGKEKEQLA